MSTVKDASAQVSFGEDTDEELLFYMALREEDPVSAREAWSTFYTRHVRYLFFICRRTYGEMLGESGVEDLVGTTFLRVYEEANTFKSGNVTNPEDLRKRARAWLGRIAENLRRDSFRRQPTLVLVEDDDKSVDWGNTSIEDATLDNESPQVQLLAEALATLSEKEQHILRITALWYRPGEENQRLPNQVVKELCAHLQTTPVALRQTRSRAIAKLKQYIESHPHH
ncbi:MAG: RNA polymerase sigma factor [Bacteroidota bacterium]